jgi:hypothetical protein
MHIIIFFFFFFLRRYNFGEVLAFPTKSFHLERFLMQFFQFFIFIFAMSLFTSSSHLFLGLPSDLVNASDHSYTFLPYCYLPYDVHVQTKPVLVLWYNLRYFCYQSVCLMVMHITAQNKCFLWRYLLQRKCSRTAAIRIDWDLESFGHAENAYNWIFQWKYATLTVWSSAVNIYCMYLRQNFSTTLDLKL